MVRARSIRLSLRRAGAFAFFGRCAQRGVSMLGFSFLAEARASGFTGGRVPARDFRDALEPTIVAALLPIRSKLLLRRRNIVV